MSHVNRIKVAAAAVFLSAGFLMLALGAFPVNQASGQESEKPEPSPEQEFDQAAAIAKLREEIKGREQEPAGEVFKNVKNFASMPAGRLLAVMQFGYARSLGVDCTHCHTPENWASESKKQKQIARDMHLMSAKINGELLKNMESLGGRQAIVNCTTCHRGQVKPATNLSRN